MSTKSIKIHTRVHWKCNANNMSTGIKCKWCFVYFSHCCSYKKVCGWAYPSHNLYNFCTMYINSGHTSKHLNTVWIIIHIWVQWIRVPKHCRHQSFCYSLVREAAWPSGQRVRLTIRRSRVWVPLWPLAGFVLGRPEFKSSAMLVNSQLVASCQLGF